MKKNILRILIVWTLLAAIYALFFKGDDVEAETFSIIQSDVVGG